MKFEVKILGCGSAIPVNKRNPTSQLIIYNSKSFLIDCGEGTQLSLKNSHAKIQALEAIFISHLHGDHYLGLLGLLSTMNLLGRKKKLLIVGPVQLQEIVDRHFSMSQFKPGYEIDFISTQDKDKELVYENKHISVYSFPLRHRVPTTGYLFEEKQKEANIIKSKISFYNIPIKEIKAIKNGADFTDKEGKLIPNKDLVIPAPAPRSYAFCSDTIYLPSIADHVKEVNLLYHEATFLSEQDDRAKKTFHSTAKQAATIATKVKAKQLIIGHYSARYKELDEFLQEAQSVFPNTSLTIDGKKFTID